MNNRVLLVDDEVNVLSAYKRHLRKDFEIDTATGGEEACALLNAAEPFAVIISDMQMPGMNGVEFLKRAADASPDSVRLMLTGNADQQTATAAINEGSVFRFLTKPCQPDDLARAVSEAASQHRLITAEKEILEQTLRGSVQVMSEILSLVNPAAFGRASRIAALIRELSQEIALTRPWELEMAAMLSQLGCVTIPENVIAKSNNGDKLSSVELQMVQSHPAVAADLLKNIPRLERVAELIGAQAKEVKGLDLEAQMLRAAIEFEAATTISVPAPVAFNQLLEKGYFSAEVINALKMVVERLPTTARELTLTQLRDGYVLAAAIESVDGQLLVGKGQTINSSMLTRLRNFAGNVKIKEPLLVYEESS